MTICPCFHCVLSQKADAAGPGEQRAAQPAQRGEQEEVDEEGHQMF